MGLYIDQFIRLNLHQYSVGLGLFMLVFLGLLYDRDSKSPLQGLVQVGLGLFAAVFIFGVSLYLFNLGKLNWSAYRGNAVYLIPTAAVLLVAIHAYWASLKEPEVNEPSGMRKLHAILWGGFLALAGSIALFLGFFLPGVLLFIAIPAGVLARRYTNTSLDTLRVCQGALILLFAVLAVSATGNYSNWGQHRYGSFYNAYEFYHYYIGSKYAPEVGYMGMYEATLIADKESQPQVKEGVESRPRFINSKGGPRNLDSGIHYPNNQPVLDREEQIKSWFTPERWEEFVTDIAFFKTELVDSRWNGILRDKGYNATPVWNAIVGRLISNKVPTSSGAHKALPFLDVALIAIAMGLVIWAFGLRAAFILIILLGTSYVMKYSHMKGAYLRTDFTMSLVMAICFMKKDYYKTAGALVAYSICSRVFPAVFLFGLGAKFLWDLIRIAPKASQALPWVRHLNALTLTLWCAYGGLVILLTAILLFPNLFYSSIISQLLLFPVWTKLIKVLIAIAMVVLVAWAAVVGLWGLYSKTLKSQYPQFFLSLAATLVVFFAFSVYYATSNGDFDRFVLQKQDTYAQQQKELRDYRKKLTLGHALPPYHTKRMAYLEEHMGEAPTAESLRLHYPFRFWEEYVQKIGKHNSDISPWRVGFKYIFVTHFQTPSRPPQWYPFNWDNFRPSLHTLHMNMMNYAKAHYPYTRGITYEQKKVLWWTIIGSMLVLSVFLVRGLKDHEALAWSFVPVFFMVAPTYYYYIMLLVPMLFFAPQIDRPSRALGCIFLLALAMPGYYLYSKLGWQQKFPTYYYHSVLYMVLVLYMAFVAGKVSLTGYLQERRS